MLIALLIGGIFGFISAIPVAGPISALVFGQGVKGNYSKGRGIALGAGLVEGAYAFIGFWGIHQFVSYLSALFVISKVASALILGMLGIYFFRSKKLRTPVADANSTAGEDRRAFLIGAGISAANPTLIATWTAVITSLYSMKLFELNYRNFGFFSVGICLGIFGWFSLLLELMSRFQDCLNEKVLDKGLKGIGVALFILAAWTLARVFY